MNNDHRSLRGSYADVIDGVADADATVEGVAAVSIDVLAQMRQAVCITDADLDLPGPRIQYVNAAYLDVFACEEADVIGCSPRFAQGPLTDRSVLDRIRAHLEAGKSIRAQTINYRVDGTPFRLQWSIDPIRRDGSVVRFVAFMSDVTIEDRMRRRLAALDALLSSARLSALNRFSSLHIAESVASALVPVLAEVARATVTIGTESTRVGGLDGTFTDASSIQLGDLGTIRLEAHHDAGRMFDRVGIDELAHHISWLFDQRR